MDVKLTDFLTSINIKENEIELFDDAKLTNATYIKSTGEVYDKTRTRTPSHPAYATDIKGIAWAVKKHDNANYNGSTDGSASVYRIDNITVSIECIDVINSGE